MPDPLPYSTPPGLDRDATMRRRRSLWPTVLIGLFAVGLLVAGLAVLAVQAVKITTVRINSASNLRLIGQALKLYADKWGVYPPSFDELLMTQDITSASFINPGGINTRARGPTTRHVIADLHAGGHLSYVYCAAPLTPGGPAGTVLAFEATSELHDGGRNFLHADGHVEYLNATAATHAMNELASGHNPPRP